MRLPGTIDPDPELIDLLERHGYHERGIDPMERFRRGMAAIRERHGAGVFDASFAGLAR